MKELVYLIALLTTIVGSGCTHGHHTISSSTQLSSHHRSNRYTIDLSAGHILHRDHLRRSFRRYNHGHRYHRSYRSHSRRHYRVHSYRGRNHWGHKYNKRTQRRGRRN